MTRVGDLIEMLKQYPEDTAVVLHKYENGNINLEDIEVVERERVCPSGYTEYFEYILLKQDEIL